MWCNSAVKRTCLSSFAVRRTRCSPVSGSRKNLVSTPEGRPQLGRAVCKLSLLGEAEAGSAGTQPCRGIAWWAHRYDENEARSADFAPRLAAHRTIDPHASENPGGLGAGPQIKKSRQYLVVFLRRRVFRIERWRGSRSKKVPHVTDRPDRRSSSISDFKQQKLCMKVLPTFLQCVSPEHPPEKKKAPGCTLRLENPCHQPTFSGAN
jgi:hypothetical protein